VAAALHLRAKERVDDALRELVADHAFPEREEVHIDMLDGIAGRPLVVDDGRAHAGDLVRSDSRTDPRAAAEDRALDIASHQRVCQEPRDDRVVVVGIRWRSVRAHVVAAGPKVLLDRGLQHLARVIRREPDLQATFA